MTWKVWTLAFILWLGMVYFAFALPAGFFVEGTLSRSLSSSDFSIGTLHLVSENDQLQRELSFLVDRKVLVTIKEVK